MSTSTSAPTTQTTRGKTQPGRARLLDALLLHRLWPAGQRNGLIVDIGVGENGVTTCELAKRLKAWHPDARVLGLDIAEHRIEGARATARRMGVSVQFSLADFRAPSQPFSAASLVRAFNLLRPYRQAELAQAHAALTAHLQPGGIAVDATSSKHGDLFAGLVLRASCRTTITRSALVFGTTGQRGFAPIQFRDVLPRDLRRSVVSNHPVGRFFEQWQHAWRSATTHGHSDPQRAFAASAAELARVDAAIDLDPCAWRAGFMVWRPPGGVPIGQS